jgi:hypothetical protein
LVGNRPVPSRRICKLCRSQSGNKAITQLFNWQKLQLRLVCAKWYRELRAVARTVIRTFIQIGEVSAQGLRKVCQMEWGELANHGH